MRLSMKTPRPISARSGSAAGILMQLIGFAGVGAVGTACHWIALLILVRVGSLEPVTASIIGSIIGAITNYVLSYHFVFRSDKQHCLIIPRFFLVAALGALINAVCMYLGVERLGFHYFHAQIVSTAIAFLSNYVLNRIWTFSDR